MMNPKNLTKRTVRVSRGFTYNYYVSPAHGSKPTLMLLHGWPDTSRLWTGLVNDFLVPNGYGVVAPDCLGFGGTSKPTDLGAYAWQHMTADMVEVMDAEGLSQAIALGHDWGSVLAQRLYNFYPSRVQGVVMLNVAYFPPTGKFNLDAVNEQTRKLYGNGIFEYWDFLTAPDAVEAMSQNPESVYSIAFSEPQTWLQTFCTPGGMRHYISQGNSQETLPYATQDHRADFMERLGRNGAFEAPVCWYKAFAGDVQNDADKLVAESAKVIDVPVLFWGGEQDVVCRPAALQASIDHGLLPIVKSVTRKGGHWALLENQGMFGEDILKWLGETFN